jgi:hypothetical protein
MKHGKMFMAAMEILPCSRTKVHGVQDLKIPVPMETKTSVQGNMF